MPFRFLTAFATAALALPILASPATAQAIDTANIIAIAAGDFNKDGVADAAMLVKGPEDNDLWLFVADPDHRLLRLHSHAVNVVWGNDVSFGQEPSIEALPNGSLKVSSKNEAIGRDRWQLSLTLAFREDALRVAGYTFSWYDTLDEANNGECDLNLFSGKGVVKGKPITFEPQRTAITDWLDERAQQLCGLR